MLYKIGRFLQLLGLILLPVGMAGNLARPDEFGTKSVIVMLGVGSGVFALGYLLQQVARRR
jgi:hypothetical protein